MPFYARRIAYIIQNPMPNPHPRTKEEIMKSFNVMIDNLPSRVGETPRIVLENFILEILDEYGAGQREEGARVMGLAGRYEGYKEEVKIITDLARQKAFEEIEEVVEEMVVDCPPKPSSAGKLTDEYANRALLYAGRFNYNKALADVLNDLTALKNQNKTNT